MDDLQSCIRNLVHSVQARMETLLPAGMAFPNSEVHKFLDQPTGGVFFMDTEHSKMILDPLQKRFEDGHRDILTSLGSVIAWLEKAEHVLHLLLAIVLASGGRTPKMDTVGGCKIHGSNRNIFHMLGSPVWADTVTHELQSYPLQVAWPLYFYIGVIRPFTIKILKVQGALSDLARLSEHMFGHILPLNRKERRWTRGDTLGVVDQFFGKPLGLKLDHNDLCQILRHTIIKYILPEVPILPQWYLDTYNIMANHTNTTSGLCYAIDDLSNFAANQQQTTHFLAISRTFHRWCGLVPTNLEPKATGNPSFPLSDTCVQLASQCASLAIVEKYQLNCADGVCKQQLEVVIGYWKTTWFTLGERKRVFPSSEDKVLMEVLATLLFKTENADHSLDIPLGSLGEELVVMALTLVSDALHGISSSPITLCTRWPKL